MTDQELLELAAKAAGFTNLTYCPAWKCMAEYDAVGKYYKWETYWNPLSHDGNALWLAVKTGEPFVVRTRCVTTMGGLIEDFNPSKQGDDLRATRRAIVRAAAEIGKAMP